MIGNNDSVGKYFLILVNLALVKIDHPCSWSIIVIDSNPGRVIYEFQLTSSINVKQTLM